MNRVKSVSSRRGFDRKVFYIYIDRFEEDWAVLEYESKTYNIPRVLLPDNVKEGDVYREVMNSQNTTIYYLPDSKLENGVFEQGQARMFVDYDIFRRRDIASWNI